MKRIKIFSLLVIFIAVLTSCASTNMDYDEALSVGQRFNAITNPENHFDTKFAEYASEGKVTYEYDSIDRVYTFRPAMISSLDWAFGTGLGTTVYPYFKVDAVTGTVTPYIFAQYEGNDWIFFEEVRVYDSNGGYWYFKDFFFDKDTQVYSNGSTRETLDESSIGDMMGYMRKMHAVRLIGDKTETISYSKDELEAIGAITDLYFRLTDK